MYNSIINNFNKFIESYKILILINIISFICISCNFVRHVHFYECFTNIISPEPLQH